ncbi:hypothetical protein ACFQUU_29045 [Herbaspirillum sp. GCM10030257]|uniref:hypothetical protein n=1 Tax=Herbaspirillum sp. GCM10030257 TaxID=3273393 RepID=UPI00361AA9D5
MTRPVEAVWRLEVRRLTRALLRPGAGLALAEDCVQDALVAAMERWRTDLLQRLDRIEAAREALRQAIVWTGNERECLLP